MSPTTSRSSGDYPLLSRAILAGASAQLRNMATTGGNLMQRTRCPYFYDIATPCNKREPGSGLLRPGRGSTATTRSWGTSESLHRHAPVRHVRRPGGPGGRRPGHRAGRRPGDPVRRVSPPARRQPRTSTRPWGRARSSPRSPCPPRDSRDHHAYLKIRDRASYAFALVSVAAALRMDGEHDHRGPRRPGRRGAQALARPAAPRRCSRARSRPGAISRRWPTPSSATPGGSGTTRSRSSWPSRTIVRGLAEAAEEPGQ